MHSPHTTYTHTYMTYTTYIRGDCYVSKLLHFRGGLRPGPLRAACGGGRYYYYFLFYLFTPEYIFISLFLSFFLSFSFFTIYTCIPVYFFIYLVYCILYLFRLPESGKKIIKPLPNPTQNCKRQNRSSARDGPRSFPAYQGHARHKKPYLASTFVGSNSAEPHPPGTAGRNQTLVASLFTPFLFACVASHRVFYPKRGGLSGGGAAWPLAKL